MNTSLCATCGRVVFWGTLAPLHTIRDVRENIKISTRGRYRFTVAYNAPILDAVDFFCRLQRCDLAGTACIPSVATRGHYHHSMGRVALGFPASGPEV